MKPTNSLLERLIESGQAEDLPALERIIHDFPEIQQTRLMNVSIDGAKDGDIVGLSDDQLISLIKSLTLIEQYPGLSRGSVSSVIGLMRTLINRDSRKKRIRLINWILQHTNNDYLPFGAPNNGAKSYSEYLEKKQFSLPRGNQEADAKMKQEHKERKAKEASALLFNALRRKDTLAIEALLGRGVDCSVKNAEGQTALEYSRTLGLEHLLVRRK